ncbi:MFS general substrate transporter [Panus rudis PR-1116 ss-1]|nr:MFS general substrate transporter [Panus rudis PR-1116 ss-1]
MSKDLTTPRSPSIDVDEDLKKVDVEHHEHVPSLNEQESLPKAGASTLKGKDAALQVLGDASTPIHITPEQDRAVLRKIDLWLMPVIVMVYFLQQLDKSSLSYTSVFGIAQDTHLVGSQYSWLGSIVYVAQLVWQPVSSYLILKLPVAKYLFVNVLLWGVVVACTAAAHDFSGLIALRFFPRYLRGYPPCFITVTQMWWRRREQTLRTLLAFLLPSAATFPRLVANRSGPQACGPLLLSKKSDLF